jgi:hypothetical protein
LSTPSCDGPKSATPFNEQINMGTAQLSPMGESGRKTFLREVELSATWSTAACATERFVDKPALNFDQECHASAS